MPSNTTLLSAHFSDRHNVLISMLGSLLNYSVNWKHPAVVGDRFGEQLRPSNADWSLIAVMPFMKRTINKHSLELSQPCKIFSRKGKIVDIINIVIINDKQKENWSHSIRTGTDV